jgi:hypothetical protein
VARTDCVDSYLLWQVLDQNREASATKWNLRWQSRPGEAVVLLLWMIYGASGTLCSVRHRPFALLSIGLTAALPASLSSTDGKRATVKAFAVFHETFPLRMYVLKHPHESIARLGVINQQEMVEAERKRQRGLESVHVGSRTHSGWEHGHYYTVSYSEFLAYEYFFGTHRTKRGISCASSGETTAS